MINRGSFMLAAAGTLPTLQLPSLALAQTGESEFELVAKVASPWRGTFLIDRDQTTEIAFVADNPGQWLYDCHLVEHAAAGILTWFEVN